MYSVAIKLKLINVRYAYFIAIFNYIHNLFGTDSFLSIYVTS